VHEAAGADWTDVEPAIFGTLLERALSAVERHKLGAHYTPRAYVERLVLPTVIEPLREDWQAAFAAAVTAARQGDLPAARETVRGFHEQLCKTRVLDPACGSGNFLYVTLEQMKRLEGEVLNALREFGDTQQTLFEVDPHQFLGIEVNPRAAAIAELVLWIGYLQWHFRTRGHATPAEPIIKNYRNIECRDAVLAWDRKEMVLDKDLKPVFWRNCGPGRNSPPRTR
jgi:type II restriction/modification system DNA methylase subunit YeeA